MEVTKKNFKDVLSNLENVFQNAQFIAVDTEYTGLKLEGTSGINYFDTLEDLYLGNRLKAETFMAIQIGLVAFFYDEKTNKYSHLGYNFYVYPSFYSNVNFTCQNTSIQFLMQHGFDFNKLFKEGIPYLKDEEVEKLLEKLKDKYEKTYSVENTKKLEIPYALKSVIDVIVSRIEKIIQCNNKETFTTERFNSYYRRFIYGAVKTKFGSSVLLESNRNETMTISVGFSAEELKQKQKEKFFMEKNDILEEIGFSKVIKLLIESKKLLIGHNLFMDILFIIRQFLVPLPHKYSDFKELVQFLFPKIIDTKYMASKIEGPKNTSLDYLVEYFESSEDLIEVLVHENGKGYKIQDKKLHEASYDAYLTGLCFLGMSERLGNLNNSTSNVFKNLPESSILESVMNKLAIPKLHDISYLNLGGLDNVPNRLGVYHLTFPHEWVREDIMNLFKNCGIIHISWIDNTSAFIKVKTEFIREVESNLMNSNQNYKLLSYSKFKNLRATSSEESLNSSLENSLGASMENFSNDSPAKTTSADLLNKRKIEDIGEVIERPQKKLCSNQES